MRGMKKFGKIFLISVWDLIKLYASNKPNNMNVSKDNGLHFRTWATCYDASIPVDGALRLKGVSSTAYKS